MKIAYVSIFSSEDISTWSGLNLHIATSLEDQGVEIIRVPPLHSPTWALISRVKAQLLTKLTGSRYLWTRDARLLKYYASQVTKALAKCECDVILSPGSEAIAYLSNTVRTPLVFWTDATFGAMAGYYPWYKNLSAQTLREGYECDNLALQRCAKAIFSSQWAVDSAIKDHGALSQRVAMVPFGSNLETDLVAGEIDALVALRLRGPLQFLFVGVEWERKGGDLALAVVTELNRLGIASELIVVGCQPPAKLLPLPAFVKLEGFINKGSAEGRQRLGELYRSTAFFIMPSRAEAFGIVFCEANSYAVPCLATATGGISTIIEHGKNGGLFPIDATVQEYISFIRARLEPNVYSKMARDSLSAYQETFNWDVAGRTVKNILEDVSEQRPIATAAHGAVKL